jgi:hypothetical protein
VSDVSSIATALPEARSRACCYCSSTLNSKRRQSRRTMSRSTARRSGGPKHDVTALITAIRRTHAVAARSKISERR